MQIPAWQAIGAVEALTIEPVTLSAFVLNAVVVTDAVLQGSGTGGQAVTPLPPFGGNAFWAFGTGYLVLTLTPTEKGLM